MNAFDTPRIAALATRLDVSPRQLLVLAARLAQAPEAPLDAARLGAELACVRSADAETEAAASLVLLGYASYGPDDVDHALRMLWPDARRGEA